MLYHCLSFFIYLFLQVFRLRLNNNNINVDDDDDDDDDDGVKRLESFADEMSSNAIAIIADSNTSDTVSMTRPADSALCNSDIVALPADTLPCDANSMSDYG